MFPVMRLVLDYVLDEEIGEGTDTVVYRARRLPGGQQVAIKLAAPHHRGDDLTRVEGQLREEARLLRRLDHPGIVPLVEFIDGGIEPGAGGAPVALVYALAEDGTVADLVARGGPLTAEQIAQWRDRLLDTLAATHRQGFVHGALSARSLLVSVDGLWLTGFGPPTGEPATAEDDRAALDQLLAGLQPNSGAKCTQEVHSAPDFGGSDAAPPPRLLPRPAAAAPDRRPLIVGVSVVGALVVLVAIAAAWLTGGTGHPSVTVARTTVVPTTRDPATSPTASVDDPGPPAKATCPGADPAIPAGAVAVAGDPSGAGCTVTVVWWPDRAEADRPEDSGSRSRFILGDPGDQLVLGDWDGDGRDTPALYDPQRGALIRFDGWAEPGQPLTGRVDPGTVPTGGLAEVLRRSGGDEIEIRPAPDN